MAISIDSSNLALALSFTSLMASEKTSRSSVTPVRALWALVCLAMSLALHHLNADGAGRALDDARRGGQVVRVQILHLLLGDFAQLRLRDLASELAADELGARLDASGLLQIPGRRRRLGDEGERLVLIDGDDGRKRGALGFLLGPRVELLAEAHDVHAALTQSRADRGRRRGRGGRHLQLDIAENLLGHWSLL